MRTAFPQERMVWRQRSKKYAAYISNTGKSANIYIED
jgi:hypothetical protein